VTLRYNLKIISKTYHPRNRESKRGFASLFYFLPPLLSGEGETGGEVDKQPIVTSIARRYTMSEITSNHPQAVEKRGKIN